VQTCKAREKKERSRTMSAFPAYPKTNYCALSCIDSKACGWTRQWVVAYDLGAVVGSWCFCDVSCRPPGIISPLEGLKKSTQHVALLAFPISDCRGRYRPTHRLPHKLWLIRTMAVRFWTELSFLSISFCSSPIARH
jgi:hypothetical protein